MGFTHRNSALASSDGSNTTIQVTVTGVVAGDLLVVWHGNGQSATMAVTDSVGSSYTLGTLNSTSVLRGQFSYAIAAASGDVQFTCTFTPTCTNRRIQAYAVVPSGTAAFDLQRADQNAASSSSPVSGNIGPTAADAIVFTGLYEENARTVSAEQFNGVTYTQLLTAALAESWWRTVSAETGQGSATLSAADRWLMNVISFSNTGGGGGPAPVLWAQSVM